MTLREHSSWIVDVHLSVRERRITSGCVTGDVRFWDLGQTCSTRTLATNMDVTAMAVHPAFDAFAWSVPLSAASSGHSMAGVAAPRRVCVRCVRRPVPSVHRKRSRSGST